MTMGGTSADSEDEEYWTWPEAIENDVSNFELFDRDSPFWTDGFLPPPPRPPFLDDGINPDGLTTCDLCSWALKTYSQSDPPSDAIFGFSQSWIVILVVVSVMSAVLGAVIMIIVLNCKSRLNEDETHRPFFCLGRRKYRSSPRPQNNEMILQSRKNVDGDISNSPKLLPPWLMLSRTKRPGPVVQLLHTTSKSATNHYTVEQEGYASINEAVYTELDRVPSPSYQNSGYMMEPDEPSSPPSSAYYSDISTQAQYEAVHTPYELDRMDNRELSRIRECRRTTQRNVDDGGFQSNYI